MYADFALAAADQAFNQIAKARHMYGGETNLPLVVRAKVAVGEGYGPQHSTDSSRPVRELARLADRRPVDPL